MDRFTKIATSEHLMDLVRSGQIKPQDITIPVVSDPSLRRTEDEESVSMKGVSPLNTPEETELRR
jgi:hypothetical protein